MDGCCWDDSDFLFFFGGEVLKDVERKGFVIEVMTRNTYV